VLRADQLMTLLSGRPEEVESVAPCTPQDFGLTEADMSAYDTRRKARRKQIDVRVLAPLEAVLEQRLRQLNQVQRQRPLSAAQKREREHLLHELEMAMMRNLQALTEQTRWGQMAKQPRTLRDFVEARTTSLLPAGAAIC
jgi:hypothetical protein